MDAEQSTPPTPTPKNNAKIITTVAVLLVAVLLIVGVKAFAGKSGGNSSDAAMNSTASTSSDSSTTSSSTDSSTTYKDGTYSADGSYVTPESDEKISVTVTLKDGKITETSASANANNRESKEWQSRFLNGYKQLVVGKSINDVKLSRVSGSSLTSTGFNNAIDSIKNQAKV